MMPVFFHARMQLDDAVDTMVQPYPGSWNPPMTSTGLHPALLRPNRMIEIMKAGGIVRSTKLNTTSPGLAEVAGLAGFDAVWLCQEHCPNSLNDIQHCVRAGRGVGIDTIVRVPRGSYSDLVRPLELGAAAIMIPHVLTGKEAKEIAWQTKFHPIGRRALDSGNLDGGYCAIPLADYMHHANSQTLVIVQIEDPEALGELDAIAATPGIDMLFFGPGDFTQGIGEPGNFTHPRINEARLAVAQAAKRHNKWLGTVGSPANFNELADMGYNCINMGGDVVALYQHYSQLIATTAAKAGSQGKTQAVSSLYA